MTTERMRDWYQKWKAVVVAGGMILGSYLAQSGWVVVTTNTRLQVVEAQVAILQADTALQFRLTRQEQRTEKIQEDISFIADVVCAVILDVPGQIRSIDQGFLRRRCDQSGLPRPTR